MISLATDWGLSSTLAARLILKHYCDEQTDEDDDNVVKSSKKNITAMLKDTTLIENKDLAYEIFMVSIYSHKTAK